MVLSWIFFALLASMLAAASSIAEKKNLIHQHPIEFSAGMSIILLLLTTPLWFFADTSTLSLQAIAWTYLGSIVGAIAFVLVAKTLRHAGISYTAPFLVFEPLFAAIIAVILLGESLSFLQAAGLGVLILGAYIINSHEHQNMLDPFKHLFKSKYNKYIFIALVLYGLDSILDKKILGTGLATHGLLGAPLGIPVLTFIPLMHFFTALNFVLYMILVHDGFQGIATGIKHNLKWVFAVAILTIGYRLSQVYAISLPGVMISLVVPIKQLSSLFATVIGGEIFHEKNILRKAIACTIMIIGTVLIVM
jgi:drug/metabolite transporter (DMT)-like permease